MHRNENNKQSKTYVQGLRSFANTLPRSVKGILRKNGYIFSEIVGKWKMFAGENISGFSYPKSIKITRGKTNGILFVAVSRGNEITVEYSKNEISNKINSYFGYKIIDEIKLQTTNSEKNKIKKHIKIKSSENFKKSINNIKSENIRNALYQLLEAIKK